MRYLGLFLLVILFQNVISQSEVSSFKFRVYLNGKDTTEFKVADPLTFLSQKAIDRRAEQNVDIDITDFAVFFDYKRIIEEQDIHIVAESKWFNTLVVHCKDSLQIGKIENLTFVDSVKFVWRGYPLKYKEKIRPRLRNIDCSNDTLHANPLGVSAPQFEFHNAHYMFNAGFLGKGVDIAVIDAGFTNVDVVPSFAHSFISGYKNFVPDGSFFSSIDHGTRVFSTMAVNLPYQIMGSAPEASYYLLRTEDERTEFPVEEDYWVAAIEYADSLGVRLVNTSLGYNQFDDATLNYTKKELTGKRALISRAVDFAFDKGMLIVGSAGNEGDKSWRKITMPGDSEKMLTIGAVTLDSTIASFSSIGPTADGRIKPDLVSIGRGAIAIEQTGKISANNGTSFSSPFLTGLIGSLWSVNPQLNRNQLVDIVRRSGHQFHSPDTILGYGIPNFEKAYQEVLKTLTLVTDRASTKIIDVSKMDGEFLIIALTERMFEPHNYSLRILDEKGNIIIAENFESNDYVFHLTDCIKEENKELYIVAQSPFNLCAVRIKI